MPNQTAADRDRGSNLIGGSTPAIDLSGLDPNGSPDFLLNVGALTDARLIVVSGGSVLATTTHTSTVGTVTSTTTTTAFSAVVGPAGHAIPDHPTTLCVSRDSAGAVDFSENTHAKSIPLWEIDTDGAGHAIAVRDRRRSGTS